MDKPCGSYKTEQSLYGIIQSENQAG